ncbi:MULTISPECIES: hypothetical protein [unclassified Novosphingobium]|uniref:hypothetical protein n=1 Tax=unclassified Novosphingobium TaxID=2644732 RepID=UPI0003B6354F|nr:MULTISPECIES: hypothetical protein [unclassified Novosphingobium]MBB3360121.1 hypothetical protein [Novosphingobium sp. BK256]MBB3376925.1 hypothetical protein [Novosphingobium sp. BK280]MBB3381289.1 hypothetical protein [Novosphingobium sp. BK258]MBB3422986.1 hypothetical protein [Novosphingobium sp. BK267]MBB3451682.1 hypothetical protein [Novosphingobium sp. BK352]
MKSDENLIKVCGEIDDTLRGLVALADRFHLTLVAANLELARDAVTQQVAEIASLTFPERANANALTSTKKN